MSVKKIVGISLVVLMGAMAAQAAIIIKDDFDNMAGAGDSITNSVLEVGSGTWEGSLESNAGYVVTGTNVTGGVLDFVTNVIDTVDGKKFIRLIIE